MGNLMKNEDTSMEYFL